MSSSDLEESPAHTTFSGGLLSNANGSATSETPLEQALLQTPRAGARETGLCDSLVYAIQAAWGGPVKVGLVLDRRQLKQRLSALQTGNPYPLAVIWTKAGGRELERALHTYFDGSRLSGEWFSPTREMGEVFGAKGGDTTRAMAQRAYEVGWEIGFNDGHPCGACGLVMCECPDSKEARARFKRLEQYVDEELWGLVAL